MLFNFDTRFSKKNLTIINCELPFGLNVFVFNENKYFCPKIFSACFFLLKCNIIVSGDFNRLDINGLLRHFRVRGHTE